VTAWWHYQTCNKVLLTSLIRRWYNKNWWTTQSCNNIVISWLYRTCWNNRVTSLIISTMLLQIVNSLFQTCWQLGTSSANNTRCWRLVARLATFFYACSAHCLLFFNHLEHRFSTAYGEFNVSLQRNRSCWFGELFIFLSLKHQSNLVGVTRFTAGYFV
jgi:hypothetical protein